MPGDAVIACGAVLPGAGTSARTRGGNAACRRLFAFLAMSSLLPCLHLIRCLKKNGQFRILYCAATAGGRGPYALRVIAHSSAQGFAVKSTEIAGMPVRPDQYHAYPQD